MHIEDVARKVQPDIGLVPYPDDTHQDHRALAQAVIPASRSIIRNVLYFEGLSSQNFNPSVYVDIGDVLDAKLDCLAAHKSQVMNNVHTGYVHRRRCALCSPLPWHPGKG